MNTDLILDIATAACLIVGSVMSLAAGIGLMRFPDLLSRMHAATKPQVFGLLLLLTGLGLQLGSWATVPVLIIAWLFQLLTVPVSAHMVGRAGYRTKHLRREILSVDDLDAVVEAAAEEESATADDGAAASAEGGVAASEEDPVTPGDRENAATAAAPAANKQDGSGTDKD